ncbi:MAG: oligosaccharide flippase family protein [Chloroflexaceae bacterium]|nr:oligosaccharide flippase family protein [Chloroflexaceae bacterium]
MVAALVAALCFPCITLFTECFEGYLRGQHKITLLNIGYTSRTVSYVIILLVAMFLDVLTLDVALVGLAFSSLVPTIVYVPTLIQDGVRTLLPRFHLDTAKALLSYGVGFQIFSSLQKLSYRLDLLIITYFLTEADVGYYSMSVNTGQLTWHFPIAISFVLLPMLASSSESKQSLEQTAMVARGTVVLMVVSVGAMGVCAQWLIPLLYGPEYLPAVVPLLLLLPGMVSGGLSHILNDYLLVQRRQLQLIGISSAGLIITTTLNLMIIPVYGINGAAVVSSIGATFVALLTVLYVARKERVSIAALILINQADITQWSSTLWKAFTSARMRFNSLRS